ncbi:hypothetical protein HOY80DRAFT_1033071 [Tuber brumale]|nr:hypothetical protein HOY80DRAFT_1033071 [Tuber brumale]
MDSVSTPPGDQTPRKPTPPPGSSYTHDGVSQLVNQLKILSNGQSLVKSPRPGAGSEGPREQTSIVGSWPQPVRGIHSTASAQEGWLLALLCHWFQFLLGFVMFGTREKNNSERPDSDESELPFGMGPRVGHKNIDCGNMEDCGNITDDIYMDKEDGGDRAGEGDNLQPGHLFGMGANVGNGNKNSGNMKGCGNVSRNRYGSSKPKGGPARKK